LFIRLLGGFEFRYWWMGEECLSEKLGFFLKCDHSIVVEFDVWCWFCAPWFGVIESCEDVFPAGILEEIVLKICFGLFYCSLV
jgi:hypothetical protein